MLNLAEYITEAGAGNPWSPQVTLHPVVRVPQNVGDCICYVNQFPASPSLPGITILSVTTNKLLVDKHKGQGHWGTSEFSIQQASKPKYNKHKF